MPSPPTAPQAPAATPRPRHRVDLGTAEAVRGLARVARLLEKASGDLGLAQYRVLSALAGGEDRASRLAERFELGRPTVSSAVDALTRAGLVERSPDMADQRAVALRLTPAGLAALEAVEAELGRVVDDLCSRLPSPKEAARTFAALGAALDARADERHARRATTPPPPSNPLARP